MVFIENKVVLLCVTMEEGASAMCSYNLVTATGLEPKWLSVRLRTKWFWVRVQLQSLHPKE